MGKSLKLPSNLLEGFIELLPIFTFTWGANDRWELYK
jgi:hypothetical protein